MRKPKTVKCRSSHCLHENKELLREDAVNPKKGCFYHPDCYQTQEEIKEIIDIFVKQINPNVVFSQLRHVINVIVYDRGIGSELLLFGIKYYIKNKISLNYPQGLYYVVQNKKMIESYKRSKKKVCSTKVEITEQEEQSFTHISAKNTGFTDILH